ncbi:MAG: protein kinase [Vicinamibacterales bacterium]
MTRRLSPMSDSDDVPWQDAEGGVRAVRLHRAPVTPTGEPERAGGPQTLPPELLRDASRRLGWAGLIYAAGYLLAYWAPFFVNRASHPEMALLGPQSLFALASIALGLVIFGLSRYGRMAPARFLDVGLVFAVFGALGISLAEFWPGFPATDSPLDFLGVPWECVWILIIPLLAPNTPGKILITSLAEASTGPLVVAAMTVFRGVPLEVTPPRVLTYFAFTTFLCAGIAYVISRIVFRYGQRLRKAREIGSYELVERLGGGGMGDVWVARHRLLARPAAIKLIRPELLGLDARGRERAITRFEREARATAALRSMHTVGVYDFGLTDEGAFFYVMELLDGISLDTLVREFGPVSPGRAAYLLRQVCHSLGEAHARGLVHRDVKPANIFVCRLGPDVDFVKVLDFGLVKELQPEESQVTQQGFGPGTPAYMAPELAMGRAAFDGRADLYAVGCVLYWLLTGEPVFDGETPMATLIAHAQQAPPAPSRKAPGPVSEAVDALVLACLAKDPADRPASAAEVAARLEAIAADEWSAGAAREWWDRHLPVSGSAGRTPARGIPVASN